MGGRCVRVMCLVCVFSSEFLRMVLNFDLCIKKFALKKVGLCIKKLKVTFSEA